MILITYVSFYYIFNVHFFNTCISYIVYVHFLTTFFMHIFEVHFGALLMYIIRSAFQMLKFFLQTMAELHEFTKRKDVLRYTQELRTQLALFGTGIIKSLQRTMGHYLQVVPAPPHSLLPVSFTSQSTPINLGNERKVP